MNGDCMRLQVYQCLKEFREHGFTNISFLNDFYRNTMIIVLRALGRGFKCKIYCRNTENQRIFLYRVKNVKPNIRKVKTHL